VDHDSKKLDEYEVGKRKTGWGYHSTPSSTVTTTNIAELIENLYSNHRLTDRTLRTCCLASPMKEGIGGDNFLAGLQTPPKKTKIRIRTILPLLFSFSIQSWRNS
jgi:hypothetical protein